MLNIENRQFWVLPQPNESIQKSDRYLIGVGCIPSFLEKLKIIIHDTMVRVLTKQGIPDSTPVGVGGKLDQPYQFKNKFDTIVKVTVQTKERGIYVLKIPELDILKGRQSDNITVKFLGYKVNKDNLFLIDTNPIRINKDVDIIDIKFLGLEEVNNDKD